MQGRLIGVNTAIYSTSGASNGIGFAIPANMVQTVLASAKMGSKQVMRPWLGSGVQSVNSAIAESLGLPRPQGVLLKEVAPGSPIAEAGLKVGDVILAINGYEIEDHESMQYRAAITPLGKPATFKIWRGGKAQELPVMMIAPPEKPARDARTLMGIHPFNGLTVWNLSPAVATEMKLNSAARGVVIADAAASRLFERGDILVEMNGKKVQSTQQLAQLLAEDMKSWKIVFQRGNQQMQVAIR